MDAVATQLAERLDAAIDNGERFSAEDAGVDELRAHDAETDKLIQNVTAFRLSDSTLWILDLIAWGNDDSGRVRPPSGYEWPDFPGEYNEGNAEAIKAWRARPEVASQEAKHTKWRTSQQVRAEEDRLDDEAFARHNHEVRRPFYILDRQSGRKWYSRA